MILTGDLTVYLLAVIPLLLFLYYLKNNPERSRLPPGPTPLPIIGNLHQVKVKDMLTSLKEMSEKYGPVFTLHFGPRRAVVLWGYDAVKEALVDQAEEFSGRGALPSFQPVMEDFGPIFSNGNRWKELRRFSTLTLRSFGMGKRSIEERVQEEAWHLIEELKKMKELPFDPTLHLSNAVSNVTCSVIFGKRFEYQDKEFLDLLKMIQNVAAFISSLPGQLYAIFPSVMKYLPGQHQQISPTLSALEKFVERRVKLNQETIDPNNPRDFIDCFLTKMEKEKENPSTEYFMKNLVITVLSLFMAGTETVSTTLRHGLLLILKYPELQEKILVEIDSVIGRDRLPSTEDRSKMPYTDAVIHEIQRFCDIVPLGLPHMVTQDTKFRGFMLRKGTEVYPILSSVLRDPTQFSNPDKFYPGHFLDEKGRFKKNDAFMPFSAGAKGLLTKYQRDAQ
ncbi:cytochrome P450 2A13-like isoform X2 [Ambystoma mexicanum]|uniref:cytochrome P450 2A13-like isoform X2 n=1 Tax=Ambystoma mexicanum TaxID=8296 RepID=UPI0037E9B16D